MRRPLLFAAGLVLAASLAVPAASAARHMLIGLQDDAQTLYGNPVKTYPVLRQLRTQIVRINLYWGGPRGVAARRPVRPQDPADPAYDWTLYDRAVRYAAQNRMQVMFSIFGTPSWANGGRARNFPPSSPSDLQKFAYAAATRYSGFYLPKESEDLAYLPAVKYWLAWNEPNNPVWLAQTSGGRFISPTTYARICNAIYTGVHFTNFRSEKVGCGATGPRGNNQPRSSRPSMSPLAFMRATKRAGLKTFDAWAHHPYYGKPSETPSSKPRDRSSVQLGNINSLIVQLDRLWKGKKRVWITEYGWQTTPDRQFAVSMTRQRTYVTQSFAIARRNPRIDLMVWFMLRDDTNIPIGWQSGLLTRSGRKKPAFTAFQRLPH